MIRKMGGLAGALYVIVIIVLIVAFAGVILGGVTAFDPSNTAPQGAAVVNIDPNNVKIDNQPTSGKQNLQLYTFSGSVVPPKKISSGTTNTTTNSSTPSNLPECNAAQSAQIDKSYDNTQCAEARASAPVCIVNAKLNMGTQLGCTWAKPVIYLYPQKPTMVDVSLKIPGQIVKSIPTYPKKGWRDVLAYPTGELHYQGKAYRELFYESSVGKIKVPDSGIVIDSKNLETKLAQLTNLLGLLPSEQEEFLSFWVPKLEVLHSPYILFSLADPQEKERTDHVEITPKPDTFIAFLVYFRPLQTPISPVKPLILPPTPKRSGFTAVEWGGTIGD